MNILGLRCSPSEFCYVVLKGSKEDWELVIQKKLKLPTGYTRPELIRWFSQEIASIIKEHKISDIGIKGTEAMRMKGKAYGERMELEAMIYLNAAESGIINVYRKVNATIAKDLGFKGKGKYLAEGVDYSNIDDYEKMSSQLQEAVQVGLSMFS